MGYSIVKTEHNGPKRRRGAWMREKAVKLASSKLRRRQARVLSLQEK